MDFDGKKYRFLVTGGAGFIGTNLCLRLLSEGQNVTLFDNYSTGSRENIVALKNAEKQFTSTGASLRIVEGDLRDLATCHEVSAGIDFILHQAALGSVPRSINDPVQSNAVNVDGFLNMLIAAREANVKRFVFASSSAVYGDDPGSPKVESRLGRPLSPYAITKLTNELYATNFFSLFKLPIIGLRYFNVFGPFQRSDSVYAAVIPIFITKLLEGVAPTINGDGSLARDFTYVDNVVQANLRACFANESALGRVFNVACGHKTTILELFNYIAKDLDSKIEPIFGPPRLGDIAFSLADIALAKSLLKYEPEVEIKEGIRRTVEWNRARRSL